MKPLALAALAGALLLGACSDKSDSDSGDPTAATSSAGSATTGASSAASAAATATKPAASATAAATAAATQATTKVSANNATRAQLQAAFEAAGIPNASQWAREVEEYRPYATTDTNMTKLRGELAKYNPAAGVVDKIVATLSLP
ncbi:MAG: hypothetical protein IPH65_10615 [Dehalococcoidia bacterium]|uniref:hypothetical protein n=1 Tax=Candidatus Amarobacter glycogenicus TaxID=3140699 RepID=UPI0031358188|nr:hypothetical protein [Dehalococcoidia bacterium]